MREREREGLVFGGKCLIGLQRKWKCENGVCVSVCVCVELRKRKGLNGEVFFIFYSSFFMGIWKGVGRWKCIFNFILVSFPTQNKSKSPWCSDQYISKLTKVEKIICNSQNNESVYLKKNERLIIFKY